MKGIDVLSDCPHNAITASYLMLPFIDDHLEDCTVHLWTNGLISREDRSVIRRLARNRNVKIILIDYSEPFHVNDSAVVTGSHHKF